MLQHCLVDEKKCHTLKLPETDVCEEPKHHRNDFKKSSVEKDQGNKSTVD